MKFTVVFPSHEAVDWSVGLVFIPSPCWVISAADHDSRRDAPGPLVNISPQDPQYRVGGLDRLFERVPRIREQLLTDQPVTVVAHSTGHGTWEDLKNLVADLQEHGFAVNLAGAITQFSF